MNLEIKHLWSHKCPKKWDQYTLIALIITIIILLILAGLTISQLSNSGLFDKTKIAKEKYENAQDDENDKIAKYENEINSYISGNRDYTLINYSTNEQDTGLKWVDNRTIYTKTIYIEHLPNSSTTTNYAHGISNIDSIWMDMENSFIKIAGLKRYVHFPWISSDNRAVIASVTELNETDIQIKTDGDRSSSSAYITVRYTKTTD